MELSGPYIVVFCTAHCSISFFFFFFFLLLQFSDPYTFSSEWGTEALIKSFFN